MSLHKTQPLDHLRPEHLQAPAQGGLRASAADPQQAPAMAVGWVDDGEEVVCAQAPSPVDHVHSDGLDAAHFAVRQTPLDKPCHRPVYRFPTGLERARRLQPTEPTRPARQESHHGAGHRTLAVAPGYVLDDNPMLGTLHSPGCVTKIGGDSPQRHKQPPPLFQAIIAGCRALATRTAYPPMRLDADLDGLWQLFVAMQAHLAEYESDEVLHPIQNGLNLQLNG
jgi:hypothetical protein